MGFKISGYVLEPPRVGQSNSAFTSTPDNFISSSSAFNTAYPSNESNPRADYHVFVVSEGDVPNADGLLVHAKFGWTKNEVIRRFDYLGQDQRFKTLPGGAIVDVGVLTATSNTQRLKVTAPVQVLAAAPFRLSLGTIGSGITQTTTLVLNDGAFGSPPVGTTEISLTTGNLNWNPADLTTYDGQAVRFQQQSYFEFDKSTGNIGLVDASTVLLNPIPGTGQFPLVRLGYGLYLTPVQRASEGSFSVNPTAGTVEWALDTGRLKFNTSDVASHVGTPVYYDGTLFALDLTLPEQDIGTVNSPTSIADLPPKGGDLIFSLPLANPYIQFIDFVYTTTFDAVGKAGQVQINPSTGAVKFSASDRSLYGSLNARVTFGDLLIEHGVSLRLFRSPVNPDASQAGIKDVSAIYPVEDAVWASPIIAAPQVSLPSVPIDDTAYPLTVSVTQGTGSFTGVLNRLDVPSPTPGVGYYIDFDARTLHYAQRKDQEATPIIQDAGALALANPLVLPGNVLLELETGANTNVFTPLTVGVDALLDSTGGIVSFTTTQGLLVGSGSASFSGTTFSDTSANFITSGVQAGDFLLILTTTAEGVYTVSSVTSATVLVTDVVALASVVGASYEIRRNREVIADRFFQEVSLLDPTTKVERIRSLGLIQNQTAIVPASSATFPDFVTLSDTGTDFLVLGVQVGDTLLLSSGVDAGNSRLVVAVAQHTLTVDSNRPFVDLTSCTYSVSRRLRVQASDLGSYRFRFGQVSFSTAVQVVADDASFSSPGSLAQGVVQASQITGNLNFSSIDVGTASLVYAILKLTPKTDYKLQPQLGLVQLTNRLLQLEEALVTYTPAPPVTSPPTPAGAPVEERATFLVRKELVQSHPTPTSTLSFNPLGRTVATTPVPAVFRGGRPQTLDTQCTVDASTSSITFLPDSHLTDALPHGATVNPSERVYVDYYVYEAIGGEATFSVLQAPLLAVQVIINEGLNNFVVSGDQTSNFPSNYLLRIEKEQVYLIGSSAYSPGSNTTTVTLAGAQIFQDSFTDPKIYVSSGSTRLTTSFPYSAYFTSEFQAFDPIARGMNTFKVFGDRSSVYRAGTVVLFTDGANSFTDFLQVTGSKYDATSAKTEVTLAANTLRQYVHGSQLLRYTVRPVFEAATTEAQTSKPPVLTQPYVVYRRTEGQAGLILSGTEYKLDDTGALTFTPALNPLEEVGLFYTGLRVISAGPRLRSSYTFAIVPTEQNGLLGQNLVANYSLYAPDNFYYRVETVTIFKAEVAADIEKSAKSGSPSSGPQTSNSSTPKLQEQGRESLYFQEKHLANVDYVARVSLKFFNDAVNDLENYLHAVDGRVVGDSDGLFKFDGAIDNPVRASLASATNQIDDQVKISPFPQPNGTTQAIYLAGPMSRFYKTLRNVFGGPTLAGSDDGDPIASVGWKNLSSLPGSAFRRWPRAQVLQSYAAGTSTFAVDNATGTSDALLRPAFVTNMRVVIQGPTGTFYLNDAAHTTVSSIGTGTPNTITLSAPVAAAVPAGATIYLAPSDASTTLSDSAQNGYAMIYQFGKDIGSKLETGELLYVKRKFPYDGSLPTVFIPKSLCINAVPAGDILQVNDVGLFNTITAPYKFPALYGGTTDDDGDQAVPMVGPTSDGELTLAGGGPLNDEYSAIRPSTGTLRTNTTAPYVGTGSLNPAKTVITDTSVSFPSPVPQIYDLVRILSGANGATSFRRVTAVGANTITVDSPFSVVDSGFTYTVTVSSLTVSGIALNTTISGTTLTDTTASFLTTAKVGWTVVMTDVLHQAQRRQIVAIPSNTQLTLSAALTNGTGAYRIDNPLDTYSGAALSFVSSALSAELTALSTQETALQDFFNTVFTTLSSSVNGVAASTTIFTDSSADFSTVTTANFVYIPSGVLAGVYAIASVDSATQLTVSTPFPGTGSGISYQVVSAFGTSIATLQDIMGILAAIPSVTAQAQAFQTLFNASIQVLLVGVPDTNAFARGYLTTDLNTRSTQVQSRITYLTDTATGPISKITKALTGSDRLYDKRYTWIDARINLESGYLVQQTRAVTNRVKAQADVLNQLIKLLTVEGS